MTKSKHKSNDKKQKTAKPSSSRSTSENSKETTQATSQHDGFRETLESFVVAFILAFLFRTFEAEAFVIPTGSMAPTLYGRHKVVECEKCHYHYTIGASDEVDNSGYLRDPLYRIKEAFCPNCRFEMTGDSIVDLPVFKGDRILVNKFPYEFTDPNRWDVGVFKYPEDPKTNYIKRIVGLPGERLLIRQGDVYRRVEEEGSKVWEILHKDDPDKQKKIQIPIYNNDFPETDLHQLGWPERWASVRKDDAHGNVAGWSQTTEGWQSEPEKHAFSFSHTNKAGNGSYQWIRYRHFVPSRSIWDAESKEQLPANPRPQLIDDFCGYNATGGGNSADDGLYWVGDLTISCQVEINDIQPEGMLLFELNEGFRKYRCRIDPNSGTATLFFPDPHDQDGNTEVILAEAETDIKGPGSYSVRFANVDDRLCLWVNDWLVSFDKSAEYQRYGAGAFPIQQPTEADLTPVGIAAKNLSGRVSHLLLERDIYYRGEYLHPDEQYYSVPHMQGYSEYTGNDKSRLRDNLSDPDAWWEEYSSHWLSNSDEIDPSILEFELGPDEFFVMGDNSPRSKDSRLWPNQRHAKHRHAVPRRALVGKAFFIYWPHGIPFLNDGKGYPDSEDSLLNTGQLKKFFYHRQAEHGNNDVIFSLEDSDYPSFRVPFYPNVHRMQRIR